ncbi:MAG: efflux RND transporter periplasmic adaptor subunit [Gammaproteobacteria bacterium]|nr:efflux RND transporter periplasmic adaptor subunit [Gammaproteobacteria bacterium]
MRAKVWIPTTLGLAAAAGLAWLVYARVQDLGETPAAGGAATRVVPVEVAEIERGPIELRRVFTGTLSAHAEFVVSPKVAGRIEELEADVADSVTRGQVVARLDNAEYVQAVAQAQAGVAVARANLVEAESLLAIADRELERAESLRRRGVGSEAQRDTAKADQLAKQAHVEVTKAELARARAELETARIRLGYTEVKADWRGGDEQRVVAERFVDEGANVAENTPLLRIVELDPITAVFFVTERDYTLLRPGQKVELATDAVPGQSFPGSIARIAPVFRESTRQARVEVQAPNPQLLLKPGMFVRTEVVLRSVDEAVVVPEQALVRRDDKDGIFEIAADGASVTWRPVEVGIREGGRVQLLVDDIGSRVVTLGQQLLDDGSAVSITDGIGTN